MSDLVSGSIETPQSIPARIPQAGAGHANSQAAQMQSSEGHRLTFTVNGVFVLRRLLPAADKPRHDPARGGRAGHCRPVRRSWRSCGPGFRCGASGKRGAGGASATHHLARPALMPTASVIAVEPLAVLSGVARLRDNAWHFTRCHGDFGACPRGLDRRSHRGPSVRRICSLRPGLCSFLVHGCLTHQGASPGRHFEPAPSHPR